MVSVVMLLAVAQPDSAAVLRSAQRAQLQFEQARARLAPRTDGHGGGNCDELIGRFCYWYDGNDAPPPAEPESIKRARGRLLDVLDSAAALVPGDWWIAGQRVRYLVESDRLPEAEAAARDCRAARWWCEALAGFARHAAADDVAADSSYAAALADMSPEQRCHWTDLTPLLEGELRRQFAQLDCPSRARLAAHLWLLAQPLLSRAGNDRRVEHFARLTMVRMMENAASAWSMYLADDLRELTVRYGWPVAWTGEITEGLVDKTPISGYERQPAFHFLPDQDGDPVPGSSPWDLSPVRPHERYAPLYAKTFVALTPDISVFRRGESTYAVVAYDLTRDTVWQRRLPIAPAVVLARDDATAPLVTRIDDSSRHGVVVARAPWAATVAGFEVTQPGTFHVGRARLALTARQPTAVAVSDLLVFDPRDSLPEDLTAVLPLVHGPHSAVSGRIGLYWEVYGLAPSEPIAMAVSVAPLHTGWLRRVGSWIGLAKQAHEVQLEWHEVAEGGPIHRAVTLDVSSLDPGRYNIIVTVTGRGRTTVSAEEVQIVRP